MNRNIRYRYLSSGLPNRIKSTRRRVQKDDVPGPGAYRPKTIESAFYSSK